jgi:hypothetical protein
MEQVKSSLQSLPLPRKIKENILRLELIKKVWKEIGDKRLGFTTPAFIEDDYLFVEGEEHYLLQQLRLQSHLLCKKLNQRLKEASLPPIKGIKTRLVGKPSPYPLAKCVRIAKPNLSSKDLQTLLELCQSLSDTELKGLFLKLIKTLYA